MPLDRRWVIPSAFLLFSMIQPALLGAERNNEDREDTFARSISTYHAPMSLGVESVRFKSSHRTVMLLGTAETNFFDGMTARRHPPMIGEVRLADGTQVSKFPSSVEFRVTATANSDGMSLVDTATIDEPGDLNAFLLDLHFQLKVYQGLRMRVLKPRVVKLIGVPADVPYDERVYRVSFDMKDVPIDSRCVLEVLSRSGERLSRFHLELL